MIDDAGIGCWVVLYPAAASCHQIVDELINHGVEYQPGCRDGDVFGLFVHTAEDYAGNASQRTQAIDKSVHVIIVLIPT